MATPDCHNRTSPATPSRRCRTRFDDTIATEATELTAEVAPSAPTTR